MNFKRVNNITGWIICIIACSVYILTMEKSGSLWDCGEFVSSCYKLQIPHPPGAPLFVLMGRIFTIPFDPAHAATGVNLMSALASGFTILFLFWSITHFARKIVMRDGGELTSTKLFSIMAAGVVGALAYTFSDSFWYSAVEGEVYACSSFFTAIVFWAMLKWEHAVDQEQTRGVKGNFTGADRWIILIFYLMGLSIGVHLLNLLTIPAIVMIYYFKRYKPTNWGTVIAFVIGCAITGFVQKAIIQWTIQGAGTFDVLFKNDFGLPFFSGFAFFFCFIIAVFFFGIRLASKKNWHFLKLGLWSMAFMLLGYSTYFTTLIRSNANPSVDMYNVDNPVNLVGYLSREQYGDWPILYGQDFTAGKVAGEEYYPEQVEKPYYIKTDKGYELKGRRVDVIYHAEDMHLFPRMWDASNDQGHADYYARFANIDKVADSRGNPQGAWSNAPTFAQNLSFFFQYQVNWMYLRYFMWNFAGKQNDIQGVAMGNRRDGNWKTGIGFIDKFRLGNQSTLPDSIKKNKANNSLFALPLILGIIGLIYHIKKDRKDALVTGLLFFFTGAAIIVYLNQAGNQPRERDYAFVGSFYAFAIWIGIGVLMVKDWISKLVKNAMAANVAAALLCTLAVPVLMASQEWDDHDRSNKLLAPDLAKDYLESCAENAILITYGDNDTYPLWYAQEVEGVRPDIRVINSSLLGTDWYINELRYAVNKSAPIDPIWTPAQIEGSTRDAVYMPESLGGAREIQIYRQKAGLTGNPTEPMDLYSALKDFAGSDDPNKMMMAGDGSVQYVMPTTNVYLPVDVNAVKANGTVNANDSVLPRLVFKIPRGYLGKNDAAILNIIAANAAHGWKRPVYFTSTQGGLGFEGFLRSDGLTTRLVPVALDAKNQVNKDHVVDVMMNKFRFGNANEKGVYFDEENRRHLITIRSAYASAARVLALSDRKEDAKKLLEKCDKMMLDENFPYGLVSRFQMHDDASTDMLEAAYLAGDSSLAAKISGSVKKDLDQQMSYFAALGDMSRAEFDAIINKYRNMLYSAQTQGQANQADNYLIDQLQEKQQPMFMEIKQVLMLNQKIASFEPQKELPPVKPTDLQPKITTQAADTGKLPVKPAANKPK